MKFLYNTLMNLKLDKSKELVIFLAILILAAFLRFYKLGKIPPALNWDETAQAYNAYSILKTGKDEHQKSFPHVYLTSFGDYKPPLYTYLTVPSLYFFGNNAFAVRFVSSLSGLITVGATYYLVKEIFKDRKKIKNNLALIVSFLLAISPWHIQLSRAAYEANLATLLTTTGVLFLLKGIKKKKYLYLSAILFALSFYTFNTPRVFVPLLGLSFVVTHFKKIWQNKKHFILAAGLFILIVAPLVPHMLSEEGRLRYREVNIFSNIKPLQQANQRMQIDNNTWWSRILHNRRFVYSRLFLKHYFDHFKAKYLFFTGDRNPRFSSQDVGQLYLFSLPFLVMGIIYLIKAINKKEHSIKETNNKIIFVFLWFFTAIIPAATARETPHALRTEVILPTFQIFIGYGIIMFWDKIKKAKKNKKFKKYLQISTISVYLLFLFYFLHNYFVHYPIKYASEWQYGYKEAFEYTAQVEDEYEKIIVSKNLGRPYIYFLFYNQYPPQKYWEDKRENIKPFGVREVNGFGKYYFVDKGDDIDAPNALWIMPPSQKPKNAKIIKEIVQPDKKVVFYIYET